MPTSLLAGLFFVRPHLVVRDARLSIVGGSPGGGCVEPPCAPPEDSCGRLDPSASESRRHTKCAATRGAPHLPQLPCPYRTVTEAETELKTVSTVVVAFVGQLGNVA